MVWWYLGAGCGELRLLVAELAPRCDVFACRGPEAGWFVGLLSYLAALWCLQRKIMSRFTVAEICSITIIGG